MFSHCFSIVFSFTKLLFTLAQLMYSSEWSKIAQIMVRNAWNLLGLTKCTGMRSHGTLQDILANSDFFGARRPKPNPLLFFGGWKTLHHKIYTTKCLWRELIFIGKTSSSAPLGLKMVFSACD